jgi:hypothetical protein
LPGQIEDWRLGPSGDNLQAAPFFDVDADYPNFNRLFAALYDLIFGKLTSMGYVIPSRNRTLRQIFTEKVPGTDRHIISLELIAYLKWLIYVSAYEDRSTVAHVEFYQKQVAFYQDATHYKMWRSLLYKELDEWFAEHPPTRKRKSHGTA